MSEDLDQRSYTPALAHSFLTPFYDISVKLFTREKTWRSKLIELTDPLPGDRILDIGCGTGTFAVWLKKSYPDCKVVGIDPDAKSLAIAKRKSAKEQVEVEWVQGFVDSASTQTLGQFSKIVTSLVLHQTSVDSKREIMEGARKMLHPDGRFCIADYGIQSTWAMKFLYRVIVQSIDGVKDTKPNAEGFIERCLADVGFDLVQQEGEYHTVTGSISILVARSTMESADCQSPSNENRE